MEEVRKQKLSNLEKEENRLHRRRKRLNRLRKNRLLVMSDSNSPLLKVEGEDKGKTQNVLVQYKNKLCLYMVEELNNAFKALESNCDSSDSEVGLSIDEEEKQEEEQVVDEIEAATSIIRSLFYQVSSKVPVHIKKQLKFTSDVYFYELLSAHLSSGLCTFVETTLLEKCRRLFPIETFPALFTMLFYRYASKFHKDKASWSVFLKGLGQILQHDVNQKTTRLRSLFLYLTTEVKLAVDDKEQVNVLKNLLARYYYYYGKSSCEEVDRFLKETEISVDFFISATLKHITKLSSQGLAEKYVYALSKLKQLEQFKHLEQNTIHQLHSVLNALTTAGAPYNPSSKLRKAAQSCLDEFFPKAKLTRRIISNVLQLNFTGVATDLVQTLSPYNFISSTN